MTTHVTSFNATLTSSDHGKIENRSAAWDAVRDASLAQTGGATVDPVICDAFASQHAWTQKYCADVDRLGGKGTRTLAVVPIGANHAQILAGGQALIRGFTLAETNIGGFPQVAFLRGDCAGLILLMREEGSDQLFTLGIRNSFRPAVGRAAVNGEYGLLESLAGMIDLPTGSISGGKFVLPPTPVFQTMLKEIKEETGGFELDPSTLINLSEWQHKKRMGLSSFRPGDEKTAANPLTPGGSDEMVHLFGGVVVLPAGSIKKLHGARGGAADEGESTLVQMIRIEEAIYMFADVKWLAGYTLLQAWQKEQMAAAVAIVTGGGGRVHCMCDSGVCTC